jgi:hypothetical protein
MATTQCSYHQYTAIESILLQVPRNGAGVDRDFASALA